MSVPNQPNLAAADSKSGCGNLAAVDGESGCGNLAATDGEKPSFCYLCKKVCNPSLIKTAVQLCYLLSPLTSGMTCSSATYEENKLKEVKNGRLAM
jgi:hypothetical protein